MSNQQGGTNLRKMSNSEIPPFGADLRCRLEANTTYR